MTPYLSISTSMASLERLRKVVKAVDAPRGSCLSSILPIRPTTAGVKDANGSPPIGVGDAEEGHLAVIMAHPPPFIPFG